jgi:hypothetical protein
VKESGCNFVRCQEFWAKEKALGSDMDEMIPGHPYDDSTIQDPTSWFGNVADANGCSGRDPFLNGVWDQ